MDIRSVERVRKLRSIESHCRLREAVRLPSNTSTGSLNPWLVTACVRGVTARPRRGSPTTRRRRRSGWTGPSTTASRPSRSAAFTQRPHRAAGLDRHRPPTGRCGTVTSRCSLASQRQEPELDAQPRPRRRPPRQPSEPSGADPAAVPSDQSAGGTRRDRSPRRRRASRGGPGTVHRTHPRPTRSPRASSWSERSSGPGPSTRCSPPGTTSARDAGTEPARGSSGSAEDPARRIQAVGRPHLGWRNG